METIANPLVFTWGTGGAQQPPSEINGYDVTLLIDVCKAYANPLCVSANFKLTHYPNCL